MYANKFRAFACALVLILWYVKASAELFSKDTTLVVTSWKDVFGAGGEATAVNKEVPLQIKTCLSSSDCHHDGQCQRRDEISKSVCQCRNGTSGDFCEIVDECDQNTMSCGNRTDVQCIYSTVDAKAICKCNNPNKSFDLKLKECRECQCGGKSSRCRFENGTKMCEGFDASPMHEASLSLSCYCGPNSESCTYDRRGEKLCSCKHNYIQDNSGLCKQAETSSWKVAAIVLAVFLVICLLLLLMGCFVRSRSRSHPESLCNEILYVCI